VQSGEAFFGRESAGGGPHWANITNLNHHFVGIGLALLGLPGSYTIYLTQVFSDAGGCGLAALDGVVTANSAAPAPRVGATMHPVIDALPLRSEPGGMVIHTMHAKDRVKVIALRGDWAQVQLLSANLYGWAFVPMLAQG
jgi:hypothetical protein